MKQITFKKIKEICHFTKNNDFANTLVIWMTEIGKARLRSDKEVYRKLGEIMLEHSKELYDVLDNLGYYDDVKE